MRIESEKLKVAVRKDGRKKESLKYPRVCISIGSGRRGLVYLSTAEMKAIFYYFVIVNLLRSCWASNFLVNIDVSTEVYEEVLLKKWSKIEENMQNTMNNILQQVLPMLIRSSSEVDISNECSASLLKLVLGVKQFKKWPILMLDASGKIPGGLLSGTSADLGNFDQCIKIAEYDEYSKELEFQGRYCLVDIRFPLAKRTKFLSMYQLMPPMEKYNTTNYVMEEMKRVHHFAYFMAFRNGVCVPSTCEQKDVLNIARYIAQQGGLNADVPHCEVKEELHFDATQIAIIVAIFIFLALCLIGTGVDVIPRLLTNEENDTKTKEQPLIKRMLTCFSVEKNVRRLMHVDPNRDKELGCIHGIRFLSMTWIILGHTYLLMNFQLMRNFANGRDVLATVSFQIIVNALVAVDCFFFLSGFLLSYLSISNVDNNGGKGFSVPLILLRRVWRLLPSTLMLIGITLLIPTIGSGPVWHETTDLLTENCLTKWWTDLVFINNFIHPTKMCLPHTWYTAADTQLFIVGLIYLLIFFKNAKYGTAFNILLVIASVVATSAVNYWRGFPPILLISNPVPEDMVEFWHYAHCKPHVHLGVFCVGLALGTFLARFQKIQLKWPVVLLFWCLSITCNLSIMFATYEWNIGNEPSEAFATFYSGVHRVGWALGLAWTAFACIKGYGGVINTILSWDGFVPLSRLTFLAYLWHYPILIIYYGYWRTGLDAFHIFVIWIFLGNLVVTFCMATISYVLYEAPVVQLERILLSFISKPKGKEEIEKEDNAETPIEDQKIRNGESKGVVVIRL